MSKSKHNDLKTMFNIFTETQCVPMIIVRNMYGENEQLTDHLFVERNGSIVEYVFYNWDNGSATLIDMTIQSDINLKDVLLGLYKEASKGNLYKFEYYPAP